MLTKFLVAVIVMLVGWMLVRHLGEPRRDAPAKAKTPKASPPAEKITTLERDPKTGIYR